MNIQEEIKEKIITYFRKIKGAKDLLETFKKYEKDFKPTEKEIAVEEVRISIYQNVVSDLLPLLDSSNVDKILKKYQYLLY